MKNTLNTLIVLIAICGCLIAQDSTAIRQYDEKMVSLQTEYKQVQERITEMQKSLLKIEGAFIVLNEMKQEALADTLIINEVKL